MCPLMEMTCLLVFAHAYLVVLLPVCVKFDSLLFKEVQPAV